MGWTTGASTSWPLRPPCRATVEKPGRGGRAVMGAPGSYQHAAAGWRIGVDLHHRYGLRGGCTDHVAQDDVAARERVVDVHGGQLVAARAVHPDQLAVHQQARGGILG